MAKQLVASVKFQVPGGQATPAPPVGTSLGKFGVNLGQFVMQFNDKTRDAGGMPIPVKDELIEQIRQRLLSSPPRPEFQEGEHVRIKDGSFCDIEAIFLAADSEERAVILLNLLQREQKVSLPLSSLARMEARI